MNGYREALAEAIGVFESLREHESAIRTAGAWCSEALSGGNKLLLCGNGGSAAEAQHLAGELVGRYKNRRAPYAAIALNADGAILTCIGNDYCYEEVFARQVQALGRAGDVLIVFTTSGNSPNVLNALAAARQQHMKTIAFLGRDGGKARDAADCAMVVRHPDTARAQEGHQFLVHALMDVIESDLAGAGGTD
jgi:D-sedoheptulose 7-phosphate isomerase